MSLFNIINRVYKVYEWVKLQDTGSVIYLYFLKKNIGFSYGNTIAQILQIITNQLRIYDMSEVWCKFRYPQHECLMNCF